jgi:DsbC/DsbD-like thiol-disulfide interchange protein
VENRLMQKFFHVWARMAMVAAAGNAKACRLFFTVPALGLLLFGGELRCEPLASSWALGSKSSVRLISGVPSRRLYSAGVEMRLDPGVITYWRNPGDAGVPPVFSFDGSENVANVTILYPAPRRLYEAGTETFGYMGGVTFPLHVSPKDPSLPVNLIMKMNYAVCERICLPNMAEAKLTLAPPGEAPLLSDVSTIAAAEADVPVLLSAKERDKTVSIIRDPSAPAPTWRLRVAKSAKDNAQDSATADLFAEAPAGWYFETRKSDRPGEFLIVEAERPRTAAGGAAPVHLTLTQPGRSYEFAVELSP